MSDIIKDSKGNEFLINHINPFHKSTIEQVQEDIVFAEFIYAKVFTRFSITYFNLYKKWPKKELKKFVI